MIPGVPRYKIAPSCYGLIEGTHAKAVIDCHLYWILLLRKGGGGQWWERGCRGGNLSIYIHDGGGGS